MTQEDAPVLLVDDLPNNLEMMQRMLSRLDIEMVLARSGQEAIAHATNRAFAVILMDVQMPVLSGIETAEIIRQQDQGMHTPIIFVTAHSADDSTISKAYQFGAIDFVNKPVNFNILRSKVSFFVELFRKNQTVQRQSQLLLDNERRERRLLEEQRALEEHGEAQRRLVRELQQANEALGNFASIVSHDLQEPLRGVVSLSELLHRRSKARLGPQECELLSTVIDEGKRMQQMIRDLLALARVGTEDTHDVAVSFEESLMVAKQNLLRVIEETNAVIISEPLPSVACHPAHAVQLLQNLLGNAIKFHGDETPRVEISVEREEGYWHFQVKDNGIGIAPRYSDKIFAPFRRLHTRARYPGTGIGLAICQRIVDKRGGKIWVDSELGKGTTFHFTLPAVPETA